MGDGRRINSICLIADKMYMMVDDAMKYALWGMITLKGSPASLMTSQVS